MFHARTSHKGLTGRDMFVRRVHWASDGTPVLDMETDEEILPELRDVSVTFTVVPWSTWRRDSPPAPARRGVGDGMIGSTCGINPGP